MPPEVLEEARERMAQADATLAEAEDLLEDGYAKPAIHAGYYAAFHAAMALLALEGVRPKTHKGVLIEIGRRYVAGGRLAEDAGAALEESLESRLKADYGVLTDVSDQEAAEVVLAARQFVEAARKLVS